MDTFHTKSMSTQHNTTSQFNTMHVNTTTILCITALLLLLSSHHVLARPGPAFDDVTPIENQRSDRVGEKEADRDNCVGLKDDECIMKRTIEAQLDYIYTQKKKKKP